MEKIKLSIILDNSNLLQEESFLSGINDSTPDCSFFLQLDDLFSTIVMSLRKALTTVLVQAVRLQKSPTT